MIKVEGHSNLYRDENTGAIVNCDTAGYNQYINTIAQKAGVVALKDQKFVQSNIQHNKKWKPLLIEKFREIGLTPLPSVANFITLEFPQDSNHNAGLALDFLHSKKIIPRTASDYGMENFIRISVGTEKENLILVDSLKEFMA